MYMMMSCDNSEKYDLGCLANKEDYKLPRDSTLTGKTQVVDCKFVPLRTMYPIVPCPQMYPVLINPKMSIRNSLHRVIPPSV